MGFHLVIWQRTFLLCSWWIRWPWRQGVSLQSGFLVHRCLHSTTCSELRKIRSGGRDFVPLKGGTQFPAVRLSWAEWNMKTAAAAVDMLLARLGPQGSLCRLPLESLRAGPRGCCSWGGEAGQAQHFPEAVPGRLSVRQRLPGGRGHQEHLSRQSPGRAMGV